MTKPELKHLVEALLLVADAPLTAEQVAEAGGVSAAEARESLEEFERESAAADRGICVRRLAGGYQYATDPALAEPVRRFIQAKEKRRLSQASLETLSIIAYRQPITRSEIEFIRGVNVDGAVKTLLEKGLLRISGRKEVPGRPILYSTTKEFLDHFGLASLKELPKLATFTEKDIELPDTLAAGEGGGLPAGEAGAAGEEAPAEEASREGN